MSQSCGINDQFLLDTSPAALENLRTLALGLIQTHFSAAANIVNNPTTVSIPFSSPFPHTRDILPSEVIVEFEQVDLEKHVGPNLQGNRALYVPDDGKTYLIRNMWCIKTVIHETLHSCSRFSTDPAFLKYLNWVEGLTELLTGYIVFREKQDCYTNCFRPMGQLCEISYPKYVPPWVAFCNFISIRNLIPIYFPTDRTLEEEINELVKIVHKQGFTDFISPLDNWTMATDVKFKIRCEKAFGDNFKQICKRRDLWTDFSKVKDN